MKRISAIIFILLFCASLFPAAPVAAQTSGYWKAAYSMFYSYAGAADINLTQAFNQVCGANPVKAIWIEISGTVDVGDYNMVNNHVRILDGTSYDTVRTSFNTFFTGTANNRFLWPAANSTGPITEFILKAESSIFEFYVWCSGSGLSDALGVNLWNRYRWETAESLIGFVNTGNSFMTDPWVDKTDLLAVSCTGDSRPAGVWYKTAPNAPYPDAQIMVTSATYWNPQSTGATVAGLNAPGEYDFNQNPYVNTFRQKYLDKYGVDITVGQTWYVRVGLTGRPGNVKLKSAVGVADARVLCFDFETEWGGVRQTEVEYGFNMLQDGNMEQQPVSSAWFPDTASGGSGNFGRLDNSSLLTVGYGDPKCGDGWQILGTTDRCAWSILEYYNLVCQQQFSSIIRQQFAWAGASKLYWAFSARGMPQSGWDRNIPVKMWITNKANNQQTVLYEGMVPPGEWSDYSGNVSNITAGYYIVSIGRGTTAAPLDAVFIDDVQISSKPPYTASCVQPAEPTPGPGTPTKTVTPTATSTPAGYAGPNILLNCGFELGPVYWSWSDQRAFVIYGPENYSHALNDAPAPAVSQLINWPGGNAFIQFKTDTSYKVQLRNNTTGQVYSVATGVKVYAGWTNHQAMIPNLPAGAYWLELHHPSGSGPSQYDDLSVATGNYQSCSEGSLHVTPTAAGATSTPYVTPTMWATATQRPTSTVAPGAATSTPRPTYTPFPTYTPAPTFPPTITPAGPSTATPYPTYTLQPTYTPNPNQTAPALGLPTEPPPPQPPPAYYAPCDRPQNGYDMAHWMEYNRCLILSYFEYSPHAASTVVAAPTLFAGSEPVGTFNELEETRKGVENLINSYDWSDSGSMITNGASITDFQPGPGSPWNGGTIDLTGTPKEIPESCQIHIAPAVGPIVASVICWLWSLLSDVGLLPWYQAMINLAAVIVCLVYLKKSWVDPFAGS